MSHNYRVDALSDALQVLRLSGAVFLAAEFTAPWCVLSTSGSPVTQPLPHGGRVLFFHLLTEGRCNARLVTGGDAVELSAGDLVMLPRDDNHLLGSDLRLSPVRAETIVKPAGPEGLMSIAHGGGGERTRFICGYMVCDERLSGQLFDALPRICRVPVGETPAIDWLHNLMNAGAQETASRRPGADTVLSKLSELLLAEGLRRYVELLPDHATGWLAGSRDRFVGRALALMHDRPRHAWTVDDLAREVGLSRSALAERFTGLVGAPPMQYLKRWRLTMAAQRLRTDGAALARIAADSGYDSEAAFNRAFKRELGVTPASWRRAL